MQAQKMSPIWYWVSPIWSDLLRFGQIWSDLVIRVTAHSLGGETNRYPYPKSNPNPVPNSHLTLTINLNHNPKK